MQFRPSIVCCRNGLFIILKLSFFGQQFQQKSSSPLWLVAFILIIIQVWNVFVAKIHLFSAHHERSNLRNENLNFKSFFLSSFAWLETRSLLAEADEFGERNWIMLFKFHEKGKTKRKKEKKPKVSYWITSSHSPGLVPLYNFQLEEE